MERVFIIQLPKGLTTWRQVHADLIQDPSLRVVACGGDGTVNWIVSVMNETFGEGGERPPLAVIPFGTGNDMSRALGWGGGMTESSIDHAERILTRIRDSTEVVQFDVWSLVVKRMESDELTSFRMLNYFSIGVDAEIARNFENCRKGCCGCCFCCQCMSLACYAPVGAKSLCCKRSLRSYSEITVESRDGTSRRLGPTGSDKTVIFQTIPSMYGGKDPWTTQGPRGVDDGLFEVTFQGGVCSLGCFQLGCNTGRPCCQARKAEIKVWEPCHYQVDGEGHVMNGPGTFSLVRVGNYPLICGPDKKF
jgi:diacylglycerol kinase (ATP)